MIGSAGMRGSSRITISLERMDGEALDPRVTNEYIARFLGAKTRLVGAQARLIFEETGDESRLSTAVQRFEKNGIRMEYTTAL